MPRTQNYRQAQLDGRFVEYLLHDQPVRFLKGRLRLRQVTRLCDGGHQTNVITSLWDLRDIEVAYRMFDRWRQENFFKYMRAPPTRPTLRTDRNNAPSCTRASATQASTSRMVSGAT